MISCHKGLSPILNDNGDGAERGLSGAPGNEDCSHEEQAADEDGQETAQEETDVATHKVDEEESESEEAVLLSGAAEDPVTRAQSGSPHCTGEGGPLGHSFSVHELAPCVYEGQRA